MKNWKRVLSLVFALALCLSATAYASENNSILDTIRGFVADSMENRDASGEADESDQFPDIFDYTGY